ncbi:DedA family protein [Methanobacterium subterraneum]|jgi:membrane protein DedA with SNARE-associated domain|uniref:Membrane-associated protein n=1 Tax=Methanobacterium subterraneum TaxID=59277 RepID=A0A2H4VQM7_9EURY|nr:VTT domain-containing protein [Methanobacterium subterraneum]MBW4258119.1 VTT domain-containing protein [Methanobacterium sp. YSL]PKL72850.1 MAG: membrane-associated protein [Methanobacteriales archaeon HGW-Methanobacteriales-2]AUB55774.1 membrane-associated protein [Methanobacterium subterraneum]AUB60362.1 membrane-associated protein [Methanobacterium subterraneum]NMO09141.1 membrane-associated protein [Methanobacterium subterraneum]
MFREIISISESFIISNVSWAVFLGCILEQIIVPIPASLIVLSSTFIILKGTSFSLPAVWTLLVKIVIPASLGITLGSFVYYTLAYKLGTPFIERTSKYLGVSVNDVLDVEKKFKDSRYDDIFMFLARCFPVIPSIAINLFCGLIRYDLKKYIITTFLGSAVQIFGWGMLAWFAGNIYLILEDKIAYMSNIVTGIIIVAVVYFIIMKRRGKNRKDGP